MEERALKRGLCWLILLVLPLVLILGVVPCAAEETHTLQDLIDNKIPIYIDNLEFSNFAEQGFSSEDLVGVYKQIDVEIVGAGTDYPGLRFTPKAGSSAWSLDEAGLQSCQFSYDVKATGSPMITGSSLFLEPGNQVAPSAARVDDLGPAELKDRYYVLQMATPGSSGNRIENTLQGEINFLEQAAVSPNLKVALSVSSGGQTSIQSFEYRVSLVPVEGRPVANAGPDQAVLDQVSLDGSASSPADAQYQWELYQKVDDGWKLFASATTVQAEFTNLEYGIYEARLTVTKGEVSAVDTALIAAAGPSGGGIEPGTQENAELNLWDFTLKKYRYCKWSTARMVGTFDLPDDLEFARGDDLVGKVTIQLNRGEEPLVVMSDDIKLKVSNWRYKLEIRKH
ncbi:MAG: PKD domain-containing protein [Deltaproteobacteria bacterium]|jgi:hypothetical protein